MYLEDIDGFLDGQVHQVSQSQTGYECVGPIPHALVLVYNPQQSGVAHQPHHKHYNGDDGVDVLKRDVNSGPVGALWMWFEFFDYSPI